MVAPQPGPLERDRSGRFKGCREYGHEATRCRELAEMPEVAAVWREREWFWTAAPDGLLGGGM